MDNLSPMYLKNFVIVYMLLRENLAKQAEGSMVRGRSEHRVFTL